MTHWIDRTLLLALIVILASLDAHLLSLAVGTVLMSAMTPIADALNHVLRIRMTYDLG